MALMECAFTGCINFHREKSIYCNLHFKLIEEQQQLAKNINLLNNLTSSKIPSFDKIPLAALISLANIYDDGEVKHKEKAWNGLRNYERIRQNKEFVKERLKHIIHHCYKALEELEYLNNNGENHSGAIMFGGSVLACYLDEERKMLKEEQEKAIKNCDESWNKIKEGNVKT